MTIILSVLFENYEVDTQLRYLCNEIWPFEALHLGSADRYLSDYVVCMLVIINFYFAYIYTLYLSHMLIIHIWLKEYKHDPYNTVDILLVTLLVILTTYSMGMLTEKCKHTFNKYMKKVFYFITNSRFRLG